MNCYEYIVKNYLVLIDMLLNYTLLYFFNKKKAKKA